MVKGAKKQMCKICTKKYQGNFTVKFLDLMFVCMDMK